MPTDTLNLSPAQIEHLNEHGTLTLWVPAEPERDHHKAIKLDGKLYKPAPHRLGDRVGIKEATRVLSFGACVAEVLYLSDGTRKIISDRGFPNRCGDVSADKLPKHAIRTYATLTTSPEPVRLGDVTEEQAVAMRYTRDFQREREEVDSAYDKFLYSVMHDHPDLTPTSYGWLFTVKEG